MTANVARTHVCDVAVVGGGILGLAIAALTAHGGYSVWVFRQSDRGKPRADTLRNQGWLQSGIMYVGHFDGDRRRGRILAAKMYAAGLGMLKDLEMPVPDGSDFGLFRVRNEADAEKLVADAEDSRIAGVRRLELNEVRDRLGPIFEDGLYYAIPDVPYPEAEVMSRLRRIAVERGANFIQVEAPVNLLRIEKSESGVSVRYEDAEVFPRVTIAAAGAGNHELLRGLEINPPMNLQQTPLLVVHNCLSITAPIFADKPRGFSFVRHPPEAGALPDGALVIGTKVDRIVPFAEPDARRISQEDIDKFATHVPPTLRDCIARGRFTAGYEVIPHAKDRKHVEPWVEWVAGFPALLLTMPGRATMGLMVARQILDEIAPKLGAPSRSTPRDAIGKWDDGIFMHFHPTYDFNDWQRPEGGN